MIRLGLYGAGNRTKALLDALWLDELYRVECVYDINPAQSEALAACYGGKVCCTPEELVSNSNVDAFLISLSPFDHAEALRKTIPAGRPVFVEKPVSFSGAEVSALADLAEQYQVPVQVGFMRRYLPESLEALRFIRDNDPGMIFNVDCTWVHHGDTEMNYCLTHQKDNFRLKVSQIPFHCCHMLDIQLLMGGPVQYVHAEGFKLTQRPYPSPDDLTAQLKFASGANGNFHYSSMVYYTEFSYRFNAENYSLKMNGGTDQLMIYRRPRFRTMQMGPRPEERKDFAAFNASYERNCLPQKINFSKGVDLANVHIMEDFVRMVQDNKAPAANLRQAARVQGLAEGMELSAKLRKTIEFTEKGIVAEQK
ncbi:MAG: Gfo/Idh/MocA family oxidoreductase [Lentisphaeria bacterium]|nr:Gfo/Idh/MocA family oxidoreductase [Lentisphaeria bacterium]